MFYDISKLTDVDNYKTYDFRIFLHLVEYFWKQTGKEFIFFYVKMVKTFINRGVAAEWSSQGNIDKLHNFPAHICQLYSKLRIVVRVMFETLLY